jgi:ABC-2 type transport system ATP-binding protein
MEERGILAGSAAAVTSDAVVTCAGLTRRFRETTAVQDVALAVARGEVFGLIGPDGAGKTTLLQMLAGILEPSAGEGAVLGFDLRRQAPRIRACIGYMSQTFTLYGRLSVAENLDFFADLHGVSPASKAERASALLQFAGLSRFTQRLARELSGGMQKKLALCCALVHDPPLLLLDEPSTGVDPVSRRDLWRLLYRALSRGTAILVSTPYMDEAEHGRGGAVRPGCVDACGQGNRVGHTRAAPIAAGRPHADHRGQPAARGPARLAGGDAGIAPVHHGRADPSARSRQRAVPA